MKNYSIKYDKKTGEKYYSLNKIARIKKRINRILNFAYSKIIRIIPKFIP